MKEEMYEEEEDEFPRQYRALTAHLHTGSADMNSRLNAYVSNHFALASLVHQQEVDRMFAEQFPNATRVSQQMSSSMYYQPAMSTNQPNSAPSQFSGAGYQQASEPYQKSRSHSMVSQASTSLAPLKHTESHGSPSPMSRHASIDETISPPDMSPNSAGTTDISSTNTTPIFSMVPNFPGGDASIDPLIVGMDHHNPAASAFTSELPAETKMLAVFDPEDPLSSVYYGDSGDMMDPSYSFMDQTAASVAPTSNPLGKTEPREYFSMAQPPTRYLNPQVGSRIGTPGGGQGDSWESWVQYD